ncbi:uncharacterized protein BXZ73DRAFT_95849 [Epithele typhae]|uniref:uncharacterized protein n=1 Tax=Epithele typhae TaxID=378194 RepID=UPI0020075C45|nr:uncharacterized protein BXZ73DRAFT_95849 [Epithele typhae]KAH9946350.1 hypothetical protein BXZ73DRAFT_95849 [Epithele typhae]
MPRRSPPTPLRLHDGPLPPRGQPRHTLPSLPCPAFHAPATGAVPAAGPVPRVRMSHKALPELVIPALAAAPVALAGPSAFSARASGVVTGAFAFAHGREASLGSLPSSPSSAGSTGPSARREREREREFVRGPWDHSGTIQVPFDIGAVLPPPMPAAVGVRGEGESLGLKKVRV